MTSEELQKSAKIAFASTFAFYLKSHFFHWNVEGANFLQYHELFGKIYEEVYGIVDDFAEKLRSLETYAPGSFSRFNMLTAVNDETDVIPLEAMLNELLADNEKLISVLKLCYKIAEQEGEVGFSNFLAERIDAHRKHAWMLRASLK